MAEILRLFFERPEDKVAANSLASILIWIFVISGLFLLVYTLYGLTYILLFGKDPIVVVEAKDNIANALVGFFFVLTSYLIVQVVSGIFGLTGIMIF